MLSQLRLRNVMNRQEEVTEEKKETCLFRVFLSLTMKFDNHAWLDDPFCLLRHTSTSTSRCT